jgi:sigma-B regulation protein RsbU (phosphoserine phosphatase)
METPSAQSMVCMEVWGGSHLADHATAFNGLDAWVYSKPYGAAARGGDVVYASSCATGRITRLMVADVAGHGQAVAATAADLRLLMRRFVNTLDQTELVGHLNRQFAALSAQAAFATAVVATYFAPTRRLTLCNAGHPRPLIYSAATSEWRFLSNDASSRATGPRNLPLGILDIADYDASDVELQEGDCVLAYTDALMEAQDADGEMLGEDGVLRLLQLLGEVDPPRLTAVLLGEIESRYPDNLAADDVTVMLVRASSRESRYSLGDRLRAAGRFMRTAIGALRPGGERPPMPDLNVANIGGAIVPALSRRWRTRG